MAADVKKYRERRTYVQGKLSAKYRGELDIVKEKLYQINQKFFDIEIYDADITKHQIRREEDGIFEFSEGAGKIINLTYPVACRIVENGQLYNITLNGIQLTNIDFESHRKLHHEEDGYVFGVFTANIIGYIVDSIELPPPPPDVPSPPEPPLIKTGIKTGRVEEINNYSKEEYWYSDYKRTYWKGRYTGSPMSGCAESIWPIFGILAACSFFALIGFHGIIALLSVAAVVLFINYFSRITTWLFRIFIAMMLLLFIYNLVNLDAQRRHPNPLPFAQNDSTENANKTIVKVDTLNANDSIIYHYRAWKDYEGRDYTGTIWIKRSAFISSNSFKNNIQIYSASDQQYDGVLSSLQLHDKDHLPGIYQLFDTLKTNRNLDSLHFAEVVVSFVQDIPYSLVVDQSCDPSLYTDNFTRSYLQNNSGDCDGNEKFGINSPVEFMTNLKGDCDTRTLLLYTILSHYGYDVAIMSSEIYSHSMLAINLPFIGKSFNANDKRYVVWETTCPGIEAGLLPVEISDLNNWRISLISNHNL